MARTRNADVVQTPWFIRIGIYIVVAVIGLALTIMGYVDPGQVDSWLGQVGNIAAVVGGLLAAVNVNKDVKKPESPPVQSAPPAPATSSGDALLAQMRERIAQNQV